MGLAEDDFDYDIKNEPMTLIWANGMEYPKYNVQANIFNGYVSEKDFYKVDTIKYHGTVNRGHFDLNFFCKYSVYT